MGTSRGAPAAASSSRGRGAQPCPLPGSDFWPQPTRGGMSAAFRGPVCGHRLWRPQDTISAAFSGCGRPGVAPAASALGTTFLLPLPVRPVRALMGCRTLTAVAPLFVTCPLCPLVGGWGIFTPRLPAVAGCPAAARAPWLFSRLLLARAWVRVSPQSVSGRGQRPLGRPPRPEGGGLRPAPPRSASRCEAPAPAAPAPQPGWWGAPIRVPPARPRRSRACGRERPGASGCTSAFTAQTPTLRPPRSPSHLCRPTRGTISFPAARAPEQGGLCRFCSPAPGSQSKQSAQSVYAKRGVYCSPRSKSRLHARFAGLPSGPQSVRLTTQYELHSSVLIIILLWSI